VTKSDQISQQQQQPQQRVSMDAVTSRHVGVSRWSHAQQPDRACLLFSLIRYYVESWRCSFNDALRVPAALATWRARLSAAAAEKWGSCFFSTCPEYDHVGTSVYTNKIISGMFHISISAKVV